MKNNFLIFITIIFIAFFLAGCSYNYDIPKKKMQEEESPLYKPSKTDQQPTFKKYYKEEDTETMNKDSEGNTDQEEDKEKNDATDTGINDVFADTDTQPPQMPS